VRATISSCKLKFASSLIPDIALSSFPVFSPLTDKEFRVLTSSLTVIGIASSFALLCNNRDGHLGRLVPGRSELFRPGRLCHARQLDVPRRQLGVSARRLREVLLSGSRWSTSVRAGRTRRPFLSASVEYGAFRKYLSGTHTAKLVVRRRRLANVE